MNVTAPRTDVHRRIDQHLDAVDAALQRSGLGRAERRQIVDDLEAQIQEMLASRAGPGATLADLEAVLAELDPPEAYAEAPHVAGERDEIPSEPPRLCRRALRSVLLTPLALIGLGVVLLVARHFAMRNAPGVQVGFGWLTLFFIPALVAIGTTALGLKALSEIRASRGRLCGLPLALTGALLWPLALLTLVVVLGVRGLFAALIDDLTRTQLSAITWTGLVVALAVDYFLVLKAWRAVKS
jgi:hypothetical protein